MPMAAARAGAKSYDKMTPKNYKLRWVLHFRSLEGTNYRVDILKEGYQGAGVSTLTGGSVPLVTDEDADDDLFKPIRTQTGYLRAVFGDDGWRELVPETNLQHKVEVYNDDTEELQWAGFMKAENYKTGMFQGVAEYEFPLICPLTALEGAELEGEPGIVYTCALLYDVLAEAHTDFERLFFPAWTPDDDLLSRVSMGNLLELNSRYDHAQPASEGNTRWKAQYTCLGVLEELCRFWGWTLRLSGRDLYFTAGECKTQEYRCIAFHNLPDYDAAPQAAAHSSHLHELDALEIADNTATEEILTGFRRVTVRASVPAAEPLLEIPFNEWEQRATWAEARTIRGNLRGEMRFEPFFGKSGLKSECQKVSVFIGPYDSGANKNFYGQWGTIFYKMFPIRFDSWQKEEEAYKHNYNFQHGLYTFGPTYGDTMQAIKLTSHQVFSLVDGAISINFNFRCTILNNTSGFFNGNGGDGKGFGLARAKMRVGGHWWDGSKWVTNKSAEFTMNVGGSESSPKEMTGTGKVITTKTLTQEPNGLEGYYIPITTPLAGDVEIVLYAPVSDAYQESIIDGLEVKFTRFQEKTRTENEYTALLSREFAEEKEVDVKFATDNNNAFGDALIISQNGRYETRFYGQEEIRPEEHLLERMAEVYRRPRHKITATFKSPGAAPIRPGDLVEDWGGQNGYATTGISRNYRDDTTTLTLQRVREY